MALLTTKKCVSCGMCGPECPNEAISMGDSTYEINSNKYTECVDHCDAPTCQKVCPIPNTILRGPVHVETGERLWDRFVLMHYTDKLQPRHRLAMRPLPCLCNKRMTCRPDKTLRVAIRHRPESNFQ